MLKRFIGWIYRKWLDEPETVWVTGQDKYGSLLREE